jgi:hypothetical protein
LSHRNSQVAVSGLSLIFREIPCIGSYCKPFLLKNELWEAADGTGEYQGDQARNARELLGLEEVTLVAAGVIELIFIVTLVDNDDGALESGELHIHHWLGCIFITESRIITSCMYISECLFV